MWKRASESLLVAGLWVATLQSAAAHGRHDAGDACSVLGDIVYRVTARRSFRSGEGITFTTAHASSRLCLNTAKAVSDGYTRAMSEMNIFVSWQTPGSLRAVSCLSADLSRCYPFQDPYVPFGSSHAAFVRDSWFAVQRTVQRFTCKEPGADATEFSPPQFKLQLQRELVRSVRGEYAEYLGR